MKIKTKKIERRKFFFSIGTGAVGIMLLNTFPFNLFAKGRDREKTEIKSGKISVKINPHAVSRNKTGAKNG